ncbi:capsid assembly protein [Roseomonas sp. BN140053]|uniref:capsid assembly protein n=1 Tax=Roseomonas sp. BN140053 TaxID=3391898 RepID=UPI0039ED8DFE
MSDSLLDAAQDGVAAGAAPSRPEEVPEKFWNAETGTLRVEALLKSYRELERKLSQRVAPPGADAPEEERQRFLRLLGVPEHPEGYEVTARHALCGPDAAVNARLHAANFTPAQVQLVYDLAAERLLPVVTEAAAQVEAQRQLDKLRAAFGGEERFAQIARQISAWGRANLPAEVFEALSTTAEGVTALHDMMQKGEPPMGRRAEAPEPADEEGLRKMMRDPRYWRSREPEFVKRVTEGFRRLTGG